MSSFTDLGYIFLGLSLVIAVYACIASLMSVRSQNNSLRTRSLISMYLIALLMVSAASVLVYSFINQDFGLRYVTMHSNTSMPLYYTIAAFYSGQEGSLLYWSTTLSVLTAISLFIYRNASYKIVGYSTTILAAVFIFFVYVLVFHANPFERLPMDMPDGQGLNPLLRDPGMLIHPPLLLAGYMSWTIPFAFGIAGLLSNDIGIRWIQLIRKPTLVAWGLQTGGLVLGGWWAYHVLGWGGYWGWDPVENVAFLPWLTGTAFLHSIMVVERRKKLQLWSISLLIATFSLSIFGTFIVRSGILSSVHNFAESDVGHYFLAFFATSLAASISLVMIKSKSLTDVTTFESATARESGFLINNIIFVSIAFATFWGTIYPMISEALGNQRITVGAPFYEKVNGPLFLMLLFLMGIGPLLNWSNTKRKILLQKLQLPISVFTICLLIGIGFSGDIVLSLGFSACSFVLATILYEYFSGAKTRTRNSSENYFYAVYSLLKVDRRKYGGYLVHLSVVILAIGIIGSSGLQTHKEINMPINSKTTIGEYTLEYTGSATIEKADHTILASQIVVSRENRETTREMLPQTIYYDNFETQPTSRVAIIPFIKEDLYIFQSGVDANSATFAIFINPLVNLVWVGSSLMILALTIIFWPVSDKRKYKTHSKSS
ncbi:MAG: cytochrome c-type biogenesis CcmF C-terminal domain-containing protein [Chloroflexota bacterium]|nr:cytochrome c-type biogenesis CcmF C-terminal domain-containing protein [Chloroflexota bacterium]